MSNVIGIIKGLVSWFNQKSTGSASSPNSMPLGQVASQSPHGPQHRQTKTYAIDPMYNGSIISDEKVTQRCGSTLEVHTVERFVETANGTITKVENLRLICGWCGGSSEIDLYCQSCSKPLCVKDLGCIQLPDTGEIKKLCPCCEAELRATWNRWRGHLPASFSITALANIQEKKQ